MDSRERFLASCRGERVDRPAVWLMRQAGRYLPEYRQIRAHHEFWEMVRRPDLAVEVALQPLRRFAIDASILFSDILVVLEAMGAQVRYREGGPVVEPLFRTDADLTRLRPVNAGQSFDYVGESIHELCRELHPSTAVIGFAGAPFTLAAYLVEGGPARSVFELKRLAYRQPDLYAELARRIAEVVGDLLSLQLEAGTDAVQLFDTWASHLSPEDFAELSAPYISQVFARLPDTTAPKILYLRNAAGHLEEASRLGCTVLSVDGSLRLEEARRRLPASLALQGNFDPAELTAGPDRIRRRVRSAVAAMREAGAGYVVNLGQGLTPETPPEGVGAFVEAVRECAE